MYALARKEEFKYPVTKAWKAGVKAELADRGRGSHTWLAEQIHCSTGELTELLGPASKYSDLVAPIHRALKWRMPKPPIPGAPEQPELDHVIDRMTDDERAFVAVAVDALRGGSGEDKRVALESLLKLMAASPQNDKT